MRNGKVALVTGSSTGIGAGIAKQLAKDGYDVAIHYSRTKEYAEAVQATCESYGVKTCLLQGDLSDKEVPGRLVRETIEKLGRLDVDVNNAGITRFQKIRDLDADTMDSMYNLNFRGMILGAKEAAKYFVENGIPGKILFNTSIRSFAEHGSDGIYGGLKAGLNRAIASFAIDLGRYGITVNGFSPGVINVAAPDPEDEQKNDFYRNAPKFIPLRRNGYAEDLGNVVSFLVSEKASYITGQVIRVDGGLSVLGGAENLRDMFDMLDIQELAKEYDPAGPYSHYTNKKKG